MNKKAGISYIVYGVLFIIIGIVIYFLAHGSTLSLILAAADAIFGIVLMIIGFSDRAKAKKAAAILGGLDDLPAVPAPAPEPAPAISEPEAAPALPAPVEDDGFDDGFDDLDSDIAQPAEAVSAADREKQLRQEVKLAEEEARIAGEDADRAEELAQQAENDLLEAQNRVRTTYGTEQQEALKEVDALTKKAGEASQDAAVAARKARVAERVYQQKKAEHRKAVAAAAQAMDDDF